jgi:BON domain
MHLGEPLFGSVPQMWPSIPTGAFGYMQPTMSVNRPFTTSQPNITMSTPAPLGSGVLGGSSMPGLASTDVYGGMMPMTQSVGAGWPGISTAIGVPGMGAEIAIGVTAPALLAAVAIRRGQPLGPTNDQEIEDFVCDALDLLPGASDVEVRCDSGRATLTGTVPHKRLKRDVGEIAWAIPSVNDVQNSVTVTQRRRSRTPGRENEATAAAAGRKQS